jgi:hypothetical protein
LGNGGWLFWRRGDVTVSAADRLAEEDEARSRNACGATSPARCALIGRPLPPYRIVKEKRATFAQTPAELPRRAKARTRWPNLFLAGDWTDTALPATIEGAIRSGFSTAKTVTN